MPPNRIEELSKKLGIPFAGPDDPIYKEGCLIWFVHPTSKKSNGGDGSSIPSNTPAPEAGATPKPEKS
ncbi:MAG TPA: hypothetical protein PKV38_01350 [bacterium]|nr:hypothetical protein [bacterium]